MTTWLARGPLGLSLGVLLLNSSLPSLLGDP